MKGAGAGERATVWDLPIRLFHWLLVLLVVGAWWTRERLDDSELHALIGYAVLTLLLFRFLWGLIGSDTARFSSFIRGPASVWAYVRGSGGLPPVGHNPLGGYSVALMLTVLTVQTGTGLFLYDGDFFWGPLNGWVSEDVADLLEEVHEFNFNLLLGLIALHVAAILYYAVAKRRDLVRPMITGKAPLPAGTPRPRIAAVWLALPLLLLAAFAVYALVTFGSA